MDVKTIEVDGRLLRVGIRPWAASTVPILLFNGILAAVSIALCGLLTPDTPVAVTAALLFASGLFRSMQFTSLSTIAFAEVPQPLMGGANAMTSTVIQLTLGMGVAIGAALLHASAWLRGAASGDVPVLWDFRIAFFAAGAIALCGAIGAAMLPHGAGAEVSGHRRA